MFRVAAALEARGPAEPRARSSERRPTIDRGRRPTGWEMVIGLEVHCELATATKLFCSCPTSFGDEPNTNVCPVCLGLPGSLPVLNEQAVELAMRLGRPWHCEVRASVFARKNYFYPDMPKDYQVSQYDQPINVDGWLELPDGPRVGIERAHIEEDTGKSTHVGGGGRIHDAGHSLVDYNRAGVPLVEIVSEPDMRTAEQAKAYVAELRAILLATGASDAKMEEGSMRVDANVSVRPAGEPSSAPAARSRTSTRCARSAGPSSTRPAARSTSSRPASGSARRPATGTRPPAAPAPCAQGGGRGLPLLPRARPRAARPRARVDRRHRRRPAPAARRPPGRAGRRRRASPHRRAVAIVVERASTTWPWPPSRPAPTRAGAHPRRAQPGRRGRRPALPERSPSWCDGDLRRAHRHPGQAVLAEMGRDRRRPGRHRRPKGFEAMDTGALEAIVDEVIAAHPDEWEQFRTGDDKARASSPASSSGKVMKATKGQADGKAVTSAEL
jgi:aspartyl-tRNA(Asn)/glutamyl-tRNA(Gln) amidotransferase subunit B